MKQMLDAKKGKILKRAEADAVITEIEYNLNAEHIDNIENQLSIIRYKMRKPTFSTDALFEIDNELYGIIEKFLNVESLFTRYPALALKTLLPLAKTVVLYMKKLISHPDLYRTTVVPCFKLPRIHIFIPGILYRLNEIRVNTDQHKSMYKYENMRKVIDAVRQINDQDPYIAQMPSYPQLRCQQINGDKSAYES